MSPVTINESDQALVRNLRQGARTVSQLEQDLGVTGNAVRQRLVRLMAAGLIERTTADDKGRGRPSHQYTLTDEGRRTAGDNFPDLARALWSEIQSIDDEAIRQQLMAGVVHRMLSDYTSEVTGNTVDERLQSVTRFFEKRNIPIEVHTSDDHTVLKVLKCPYPDLDDQQHQFCEIEKQLFSQALEAPVELSQCRKDGDGCCSFRKATDSQ